MVSLQALIACGPGNAKKSTDSDAEVRLTKSEDALFRAEFDRALDVVTLSDTDLSNLSSQHQIQMTLQRFRVESFRNIVRRQSADREAKLNLLLSYSEEAEKIELPDIKAEYYLMLSSTLRSTGSADSAEKYEDRAVTLLTESKNNKRIAEIRANRISRFHNQLLGQGKKEEILKLIPEYHEEIAFSKQHSTYALAYNTRHLGQIHRRQTYDFEEALKWFEESLKLRQEIGFKPFIPASISSLGDVHLAAGDLERSIQAYEQSFAEADKINFIRYRVYPRMQIGDIYVQLGDQQQAVTMFEQALDIAIATNYESAEEQLRKRLNDLTNTSNQ